jgi:hypothetical protein
MERHALLSLSAATFAIALFSFEAGRQSRGTKDAIPTADFSRRDAELHRTSVREKEIADLSKATIENVGQLEFEEAYDLLRSAPREVLEIWVRRLEALPTGPRKTAAISTFFKTFAQFDTKTAAELALMLTRHEPRWTAIAAISAAAPAKNLPDLARMLASLNLKKFTVTELVVSWSRTDPVSTSQFLAAHPDMIQAYDLKLLMSNWAALDPAAAEAWLDNLEADRRDAGVYEGFYDGWFERDRTAAVNHLVAHAADEKRKTSVESCAETLFLDSPNDARAFVLNLPKGNARDAAISQITAHVRGFTRESESREPATVAQWLLTLPEDAWQGHIGYVISSWSEEDGAAVDRWLGEMPTETHDRIAADFCLAFNWDKPQRSFEAGLKIKDQQLRQETFRQAFKKIDSKKRARKVLSRMNLPPEQAAELEGIVAGL